MTVTPANGVDPRGQFPPIGDYGFLSDCETTALVALDGGVEWLCQAKGWDTLSNGALLNAAEAVNQA